jgi:glucose/arabinose dehydrogenase
MTRISFFFACYVAGMACSNVSADRSSGSDTTDTVTDAAPVETRLTPPAGTKATIFATVTGARAMVVGPDGAVYVSQPGSNQITRLTDADHDGVAETSVAVTGLKSPHGMAFHNGFFYIANTNGVVRVQLDETGKATGTPRQLNHYANGGSHWTRSIVFGTDGKMYVSIGSSCNVCVERDSTRAAVMQYDADGTHGRVYAKGLRNAVGIALHPTTHAVWVVQNERDNLEPNHENLPPEELNILQSGGDYGWPYCYGNKIPSPEFHNAARCATTIAPALELQAHSAPLGLTFLQNATHLPTDQRGDVLVTYHGSWNRSTPTGAKVVRVRVVNNQPTGVEDFVTGWQRSDGSRWGRPVDVVVMTDGSVLISDDTSGEIIRISKS